MRRRIAIASWGRLEWGLLLAGTILAGAGAAWIARGALAAQHAAFENDARIAHRVLSQRVVQHDAVLATLALLQPASAGEGGPEQRLPALYPQVLRVLRRADNAGPHTLASAQAKAYTSASARANTMAMMENAQKNPAAANLVHMPGFLLLGGGVPIRAGNDVIGAVGVGGAPGGDLDEQCAMAALDKAKDLLK